jgi:PhnB protein
MTSIAPWLTVHDASRALEFYQAAFGAIELERLEDEAGSLAVAQLSIDGADFWISTDPDLSTARTDGGAVRMILSVDDPDTVFARALVAGASEVTPIYQGYGWRIGRLADPSGHHWEVGRRLTT